MALELTTAVTWQHVRDRAGVRQGATVPNVEAEATRLLGLAVERLEEALEHAFRLPGQNTYDEWVLTVAKALADRRRTPGNGQTTTPEDAQLRNIPRDPLTGIKGELARYVVGLA